MSGLPNKTCGFGVPGWPMWKASVVCAAACFLTGARLEQIKADVATQHDVKPAESVRMAIRGWINHHSTESFLDAGYRNIAVCTCRQVETSAANGMGSLPCRFPSSLRLSTVRFPDLSGDTPFELGKAQQASARALISTISPTEPCASRGIICWEFLPGRAIEAGLKHLATVQPMTRAISRPPATPARF